MGHQFDRPSRHANCHIALTMYQDFVETEKQRERKGERERERVRMKDKECNTI